MSGSREAAKRAKAKRKKSSAPSGAGGKPRSLGAWLKSADLRHDKRLPGLWGALSLDVRHKDYLPPTSEDYHWALRSHCYVMVEAAYHGFAKAEGFEAYVHKHEHGSHWWLRHRESGRILDPSWPQLEAPYPYQLGHKQTLVPPSPSKRAREIMRRAARKKRSEY